MKVIYSIFIFVVCFSATSAYSNIIVHTDNSNVLFYEIQPDDSIKITFNFIVVAAPITGKIKEIKVSKVKCEHCNVEDLNPEKIDSLKKDMIKAIYKMGSFHNSSWSKAEIPINIGKVVLRKEYMYLESND